MRRLLLLPVAVWFLGCSSGTGRPVVSFDAVPDAEGVQRVEVHMHSYYFEPNRIVVHNRQPVELILKNSSVVVPHNFTIADSALAVSGSKWGFGSCHVKFTPTVPGEYAFFCHKDGHAKKGMKGTLVVLP